jgi:polysaccharide biosynthesis/export protein
MRASMPRWRTVLGLAVLAGTAPGLVGCTETDAWLLDPSVIGRWEQTPTTVPILSRLASVEGPEDEFVEVSDVSPADLIPEVAEYRIGPGDRLLVTMFDFPDVDRPAAPLDTIVDPRGYLNLPQLQPVFVSGLTVQGAQQAVQQAMEVFIEPARAFVQVVQPRQQLVHIFGGVASGGPYNIPSADYRILQALAAAGGFSEAPQYIYVIRQIPLADIGGRPIPAAPRGADDPAPRPPEGERLIDIIDQFTRPGETPPPGGNPPPGNPAVFQPQGEPEAPIQLIDPSSPQAQQPAPQPSPDAGDMTWIHVNGRWVRVRQPGATALPAFPGGPTPSEDQLVTQRVIRIPVVPLRNGDARYNIVVRPGDIVRVPPPPAGTIYLAGQIVRPGAFNMAENLTLQRAIAAAGGLTQIAVPERTDIVRMVGPDRQAFLRVNLRAVAEGTHPDIYLKQNDYINVGTNFWATPLAVIRNGFRATYGFGFLADRNFGNDIFGAPPAERFR